MDGEMDGCDLYRVLIDLCAKKEEREKKEENVMAIFMRAVCVVCAVCSSSVGVG